MGDWNSNQYLKFDGQRTRLSVDLIRNIPALNTRNILDVGCGPGNSLSLIHIWVIQSVTPYWWTTELLPLPLSLPLITATASLSMKPQ